MLNRTEKKSTVICRDGNEYRNRIKTDQLLFGHPLKRVHNWIPVIEKPKKAENEDVHGVF